MLLSHSNPWQPCLFCTFWAGDVAQYSAFPDNTQTYRRCPEDIIMGFLGSSWDVPPKNENIPKSIPSVTGKHVLMDSHGHPTGLFFRKIRGMCLGYVLFVHCSFSCEEHNIDFAKTHKCTSGRYAKYARVWLMSQGW